MKVVKAGGISHRPTHFSDFLATFVDITEAKYPSEFRNQKIVPLQGESFLPILKGEDVKRKNPLFWNWKKGKAVRRGDWKLVSHGKWELYNLKKDRSETNNVINEHPEIASELEQLFNNWSKSHNSK